MVRRAARPLVLGSACAVLAVLTLYLECGRGVELRLRNRTATPLHNVIVYVTGRTYTIDKIAVGEVARLHVKPTSESDIKVSLPGRAERLTVEAYFEPGYGGYVYAEVTAKGIANVRDEIRLVCWLPW